MIEATTVDAGSTIRLLEAIEALYPMLALIHVFLDNARYHHAKLVQDWLSSCGIRPRGAKHAGAGTCQIRSGYFPISHDHPLLT